MKEFIIVFLVALAVTSLFSGWNPFASNAPVQAQTQQSANSDQGLSGAANQAAGQAAPASGNSNTANGSPL